MIKGIKQMSFSVCTRQSPTLDEIGMVYCYWWGLSCNASSRWPSAIKLFFFQHPEQSNVGAQTLDSYVLYILSVLLRPSQN